MRHIVLFFIFIFAPVVAANTLKTSNFEIVIGTCEEGVVSCYDVPVTIRNLKNGVLEKVLGKTVHTLCGDGVTPCAFQGYQFKYSNSQFMINNSGKVIITASNGSVKTEDGEWQ
jgi:hypothetical protein